MPSYFFDKKFLNQQIASMYQSGGHYQNAASKVKAILYDISNNVENPFRGIPLTNHGETRIENCVKYDLNGFSRLITIQFDSTVIIVFFGKHTECERWLDNNRGKKITYDPSKKVIVDVYETEDLTSLNALRKVESDFTSKPLHQKLGEQYFNKISSLISGREIMPFLKIDSTVDEDELLQYCLAIENTELQSLFVDVFTSLIEGDVDGSKNRINFYFDCLISIKKLDEKDVKEIVSSDSYIKSTDVDPEILEFIVNKASWQEFMLFLHPFQREIVQKDFTGVARLLGVSGSGKTSVLVHRALRLAELYKGEKILILTLNSSLAKLLENLVDELIEFKNKRQLKEQITVLSYWKFCRDKLLNFKKGEPMIQKKYESKGYKDGNIKDIWTEYYLYKQDEFNGEVLFPIHQSLLSRNVNPKKYIKDEFDWLRSAYNINEREDYLVNEREGRSINFSQDFRINILKGLEAWEHKMDFVGVSDYMNLTTELYPFLDRIEPEYRCVLVDEIQDFGTTELQIIKRLAKDNSNNFFFTGDLAQQVYAKNHKIRNAGFNILPEGYLQIVKNYRNSREILDAAYNMFITNVSRENIESEDFKILNPEYANFSSTKPFIRKGEFLIDEIGSAISYLKSLGEDGKKFCIAICGLGYFSINNLGKQLKLPILDGSLELRDSNIFLSDLEQTKGFEFDRMIILNVSENIFPNPTLPEEEVYRDICRLYVAMTRAKKELIISYSGSLSRVFSNIEQYYFFDNWSEHILECPKISLDIEIGKESSKNVIDLRVIGKEFVLSQENLKISKALQDKLIDTVTGKSLTGGRELEWKTVHDLFVDIGVVRNLIPIRNLFGPTTYEELLRLKEILNKA